MIKTFEFRLYPNAIQQAALWKQLKLTRELYNQGLEELIAYHKTTGKYLNRYAHDRKHGKKEHPEIPAVLVDTTILRLHQSFAHFFRRCKEIETKKKGFPRFKPANRWHSLQFRDALNGIRDNYFVTPKITGGQIRFKRHRDIEGRLKFCRVLRRPSGWYLQAVCETEPTRLPPTGKSIGLDFGLIHLIGDSDGSKVANPRHLKWSLRKLRMAQRRISRRKKGSHRRRKACLLAARIHEKIGRQRMDYLHKTARNYVNQFDLIALEDLKVSNMLRCNRLARSISDASWSMLRILLESKAEEAGKRVVAVPPQWTSQKCSQCGEIVKKSISTRTHHCPHCGYTDCRDTNAAKNILALALG